jgi:hypothetical protein
MGTAAGRPRNCKHCSLQVEERPILRTASSALTAPGASRLLSLRCRLVSGRAVLLFRLMSEAKLSEPLGPLMKCVSLGLVLSHRLVLFPLCGALEPGFRQLSGPSLRCVTHNTNPFMQTGMLGHLTHQAVIWIIAG